MSEVRSEAYKKGWRAGETHVPWDGYELNPYSKDPERSEWQAGYDEADAKFWAHRHAEPAREKSPEDKLHAKMDEVLAELKAIHALLRLKNMP